MKIKLKNIIIPGFIIAVILPFILVTDLFPFARFGMFAEPVSSIDTLEVFEPEFLKDKRWQEIDSQKFGMYSGSFLYLAHNYFYRNQAREFLEKLHVAAGDTGIKQWRLLKISIPGNNYQHADTSVTETLMIR